MTPELEVDAAIERLNKLIKKVADSLYSNATIADVKEWKDSLDLLSHTIARQEEEIAGLRADVETRDKAMIELANHVGKHCCPFKLKPGCKRRCLYYPCNSAACIQTRIAAALEAAKEKTS